MQSEEIKQNKPNIMNKVNSIRVKKGNSILKITKKENKLMKDNSWISNCDNNGDASINISSISVSESGDNKFTTIDLLNTIDSNNNARKDTVMDTTINLKKSDSNLEVRENKSGYLSEESKSNVREERKNEKVNTLNGETNLKTEVTKIKQYQCLKQTESEANNTCKGVITTITTQSKNIRTQKDFYIKLLILTILVIIILVFLSILTISLFK